MSTCPPSPFKLGALTCRGAARRRNQECLLPSAIMAGFPPIAVLYTLFLGFSKQPFPAGKDVLLLMAAAAAAYFAARLVLCRPPAGDSQPLARLRTVVEAAVISAGGGMISLVAAGGAVPTSKVKAAGFHGPLVVHALLVMLAAFFGSILLLLVLSVNTPPRRATVFLSPAAYTITTLAATLVIALSFFLGLYKQPFAAGEDVLLLTAATAAACFAAGLILRRPAAGHPHPLARLRTVVEAAVAAAGSGMITLVAARGALPTSNVKATGFQGPFVVHVLWVMSAAFFGSMLLLHVLSVGTPLRWVTVFLSPAAYTITTLADTLVIAVSFFLGLGKQPFPAGEDVLLLMAAAAASCFAARLVLRRPPAGHPHPLARLRMVVEAAVAAAAGGMITLVAAGGAVPTSNVKAAGFQGPLVVHALLVMSAAFFGSMLLLLVLSVSTPPRWATVFLSPAASAITTLAATLVIAVSFFLGFAAMLFS